MNYMKLLKDHNLKATPQRLTIVEQLCQHGHMNIDDIYRALQKKFPSISLATIYKNINAMTEIAFLSEVKIPTKKSVYEITKEEHSHVVCTECNKVIDVELETQQLIEEAQKKSGFTLCKSSIVFDGICNECKDNK